MILICNGILKLSKCGLKPGFFKICHHTKYNMDRFVSFRFENQLENSKYFIALEKVGYPSKLFRQKVSLTLKAAAKAIIEKIIMAMKPLW
jgi:hypothetical protein